MDCQCNKLLISKQKKSHTCHSHRLHNLCDIEKVLKQVMLYNMTTYQSYKKYINFRID